MGNKNSVLRRLLFLGGPPRSGTTILARILNQHPQIMTIIDDHVFEFWGLYDYSTHSGLVSQIQNRPVSRTYARNFLWRNIKAGRWLNGAAPSQKTLGLPPSPPPERSGSPLLPAGRKTIRYKYPISKIKNLRYISIKSPEISLVLPELSSLFPESSFILTYRPLEALAESMFRKGKTVTQIPVFWRRWETTIDKNGKLIPPSVVPGGWREHWQTATDFQRCLLCAAGYLSQITQGLKKLNPDKAFLFLHSDLRDNPIPVLNKIAGFLNIEDKPLQPLTKIIRNFYYPLDSGLKQEMADLGKKVNLTQLWDDIQQFDSIKRDRL